MKLLFYYVILCSCLFYACTEKSARKEFEFHGGCFNAAIPFNPTDVVAADINDVYTDRITRQVLEGLFELNSKTLVPEKRLVKDFSVENEGQRYKFTLRDDIYFHPHSLIGDSRLLTIEDVIFSFESACKANAKSEPSVLYQLVFKGKVRGATRFHNGETNSIAGVYEENGQLVIELEEADYTFTEKLCAPSAKILPKEIIEEHQESSLIGTGPFVYQGTQLLDDDQAILLTKNHRYYRMDEQGYALPYLDSVLFYIEPKSLHQLSAFEEGRIHHIEELSPGRISMMFETHADAFFEEPQQILLRRMPILGTQFYVLNMEAPALKDVRVRKALNYAFDKQKLVKDVLKDQAYGPGYRGIVPPFVFSEYDKNDSLLQGYSFDVEKAKALLAEAGFPNGEGFPALRLMFDKGTMHSAVATEFAAQMEQNLGIIVNLEGNSFQRLNAAMDRGQGDIFRSSWYADYKSPESFLYCYNSFLVPDHPGEASKVNSSRYKNSTFDQFFEKAIQSSNLKDRLSYFARAEKVLLEEVPFVILWYDESISMTYSKVRNLDVNEINLYTLDRVYFKDWTLEEYQKKTQIKG